MLNGLTRKGGVLATALSTAILASCGGGGGGGNTSTSSIVNDGIGASNLNSNCTGSCVDAFAATQPGEVSLSTTDVQTIIAQAVFEAQAFNIDATIAVVDRVGNVLAVYRMADIVPAPPAADNRPVTISSQGVESRSAQRGALTDPTGLEGLGVIPDQLAAIAKAVTAAYLSTEGMAFTTRTAGQIIQENFNPGEVGQPGGPLFGVQFSQLPCSDLNRRFDPANINDMAGPQRSPLGLSADPGGVPLYKNGVLVGAVGVIADGNYGIDLTLTDTDSSMDELIAVAGTFGFGAPLDRRGNRITVDGKSFRFTDIDYDDLNRDPRNAAAFGALGAVGSLVAVTNYTDGTIRPGTVFSQSGSGIAQADPNAFFGPDAPTPAETAELAAIDAFVLTDENDVPRFNPRDGSTLPVGVRLTAEEVQTLLIEAIKVANMSRAQIRRPSGSPMSVTVSVVDSAGVVLGILRTRDAPIFGIDVGLQKARTSAFISSTNAANNLMNLVDLDLATPIRDASFFYQTGGPGLGNLVDGVRTDVASYVTNLRNFLGDQTALANGIAFADRSGGNLSRPFFPDGNTGNTNGPLSKPISQWSPFSTGLQLDLVYRQIVTHVVNSATGVADNNAQAGCTGFPLAANTPLANGLQIFPGSVPIYRGNTLVGGIGVSGDGVDQDDLVAFLGLHNAGVQLATGVGNAPTAIRANTINVPGFGAQVGLRYVQCPIAPFNNSNEMNVCSGK